MAKMVNLVCFTQKELKRSGTTLKGTERNERDHSKVLRACITLVRGEKPNLLREDRKAGDGRRLIKVCAMIVDGDANNGRSGWLRWWWRFFGGKGIDLHGDERFVTYY